MATYVPLRTTGSSKDWDTTGLSQHQTNKNHNKEKEHSDVFTNNIHCGIVRWPKKELVRYRCLRTSLSVQQAIRRRRTGTQRDCRSNEGKKHKEKSAANFHRRHTLWHHQAAKKQNYLDIDVYVRPSPYNRLFVEEGLGHNKTVAARGETEQGERSIAMFSQTTYTAASSGGKKKKKKEREREKNHSHTDVYVRPSPYNWLFVEEGLGHNETVTAREGWGGGGEQNKEKGAQRCFHRRHTLWHHQTAIFLFYFYLVIDVCVRRSSYKRLFVERLRRNGTVTATTRGDKKHNKERCTAMSSQTAYTAASSGGKKKEKIITQIYKSTYVPLRTTGSL